MNTKYLINIRPLQPSDELIMNLIKNRLAPHWQESCEEIDEHYIRPSLLGGYPFIFIATTESGEFAGNIFLGLEKNCFLNINNQLWLNALFVPEKFRKQGIGRELVRIAEEKAQSLGFKKLYLDTVQAVGFYEKLGGWQKIGTDLWLGQTTTIMMKDI